MHTQVIENSYIGSQSYLSSDYLNLFTDILILLEEVADHPAYMDDIRKWTPKSYCEHFRESTLPFSDLAIWAFENAPAGTLETFKAHVDQAVVLIQETRAAIEVAHDTGTLAGLSSWLERQVEEIRNILDQTSALIDRNERHVSQDEIDKLMGF